LLPLPQPSCSLETLPLAAVAQQLARCPRAAATLPTEQEEPDHPPGISAWFPTRRLSAAAWHRVRWSGSRQARRLWAKGGIPRCSCAA